MYVPIAVVVVIALVVVVVDLAAVVVEIVVVVVVVVVAVLVVVIAVGVRGAGCAWLAAPQDPTWRPSPGSASPGVMSEDEQGRCLIPDRYGHVLAPTWRPSPGSAPPSVMSSDEQGRCLIPDGYGYVPWMHAYGSYVFCTVYIQSTYSLHYSLH